jgi:hypothetical protein
VGNIFSVMSVSRRIRENYTGMILKVWWKKDKSMHVPFSGCKLYGIWALLNPIFQSIFVYVYILVLAHAF